MSTSPLFPNARVEGGDYRWLKVWVDGATRPLAPLLLFVKGARALQAYLGLTLLRVRRAAGARSQSRQKSLNRVGADSV